jgi:hypothetical protein
MDAAGMSGERKAALALASLGETDRAWMLAQLPEAPRARVSALLGELSEMRVSFDHELVRQLGQEPKKEREKEAHGLEGADAHAVSAVLEREPDWLVALVLRARPWPWRTAFLQRVGTERARRVTRVAPQAPALRPKLVAALLAALEAKVREEPVAGAPASPKPFWRRRLAWRR